MRMPPKLNVCPVCESENLLPTSSGFLEPLTMLFPLIFLSSRSFFPLSLLSTSRSLPSLSRCFSSSPSHCLSFSPSCCFPSSPSSASTIASRCLVTLAHNVTDFFTIHLDCRNTSTPPTVKSHQVPNLKADPSFNISITPYSLVFTRLYFSRILTHSTSRLAMQFSRAGSSTRDCTTTRSSRDK